MNLNNIKTGVKLIKEIVANSKSTIAPWHKKNQVEATKKVVSDRPVKEEK